jgi:signal transduction histidine kinase
MWLEVDELRLPATAGAGRVLRLRDVTRQMDLRREVWSFNALVSHKLRTPLSGLSGSLELLAEFGHELPLEESQRLISMAYQGLGRLRTQIEQVLRYVNTPGLAKAGAPFDVATLAVVLAELENDLRLKPITLSVSPEVESTWVWPAQPALELALRELLTNSRKFHPAGQPAVSVQVGPGAPGYLRLSLSDDGLTLTAEQLSRLWSPYYQAEKSLTGEVPGMGLGLSMIAALMWTVGGRCQAFNRDGGPGLTIELQLPLAEAPASSPHSGAAAVLFSALDANVAAP